jgi:hypothetical protein
LWRGRGLRGKWQSQGKHQQKESGDPIHRWKPV